jgi:hypothetical protein
LRSRATLRSVAGQAEHELVAGAVAEHRVDAFEMVHVDHHDRAGAAGLQRSFDLSLQRPTVGQVGQRVMQRHVFGTADRQMLFGDVAGGAADAEHFAHFIAGDAGVDADPAVLAARSAEVGHMVLYLAIAAQRRQEAAIGYVRTVGLEAEKAASDQVARRQPENFMGRGVEVGEASLGIGLPDQVV